MTKIKNLPKELRPRELLLLNGAESLSNAELLAILLGTGSKKEGVGEISQRVFPPYTQHIFSHQLNPLLISDKLDIPQTHAIKLVALSELAKRMYKKEYPIHIYSPEDVYAKLAYIQSYSKEYLIGLYLNARREVIHEEVISIGTVDASLVSPKEVIEPAIRYHASHIIICHNHPSGDPSPSEEDMVVTKRMQEACKIVNTKLLDHIIIGKKKFVTILH